MNAIAANRVGVHDIFGPGSNVKGRVISDYDKIGEIVKSCRSLRFVIILTSGTFDLFHEGHARYLENAKQLGDLLIVGVDNDEKVRKRKGPNRPIVSEGSRTEILCHCRHVDIVFLKKLGDPRWNLIKTVRPDILIATEKTYTPEQTKELTQFCGEVKVLQPLAATSTTALIRNILVGMASGTVEQATVRLQKAVDDVTEILKPLIGGGHK